jgi:transposase
MATRYNPVIRTVYQRFFEAGKAKKVALVACARKLLCILNAMLKHQQHWNLNPATQIS